MSGGLPSGSDPSQMTPHPYSVVGGGFASLKNRTEGNVRATLESEVRSDPGITGLSNQVFAGLNPVLGIVGGLLESLLRKIFGFIPFIDFEDVQSATEQLLDQVDNFFSNLRQFLGDINFLDPDFDPLDAAFSFIELVLSPTGLLGGAAWEELYEELTGISNPIDALGALGRFLSSSLVSTLRTWRIPLIPLSHIRNVQPNLLLDGHFDVAPVGIDQTEWDWDNVDGYTKPGCVSVMADGTTHVLYANRIDVAGDDELDITFRTKYSGVVSPPNSNGIRIFVNAYDDTETLLETVMVDSILSPTGASGDWNTILSGEYPVHDDATYIVVGVYVTSSVTAGTVKFDAGEVRKVGQFQQSYVGGLVGALQQIVFNAQNMINKMWEGILDLNLPFGVDILLEELTSLLRNIPPINIGGLFGGSIIDTIQDTIDHLWDGFTRFFGFGGGKSANDVAQQAAELAEKADQGLQLAEWNNAVLGLRNNEPLYTGIDETEESTFLLTDLMTGTAEPPSFGVTSTTAAIGYWRATKDSLKGFISWFGKGFTNVTGLYCDVYRLDYNTDQQVLLNSSGNLVGQVTNSWGYVQYYMDPEDRVQVNHGDVLAIQIRVEGTGTHTVAGRQAPWEPEHPTIVPKKLAAVRNTSTTGVGTQDFTEIVWSGNLPWLGIGIVEGDVPPPYFAPRTSSMTTPGVNVYNIPEWATHLDVILLGAGGGGHGGHGGNGAAGNGGQAGEWATETLVRGVDFPNEVTALSIYVGEGGARGLKEQDGSDGEATLRDAIPGGKTWLTAAGGLGGDWYAEEWDGEGAGEQVYNGVTYMGGATAQGGGSDPNGKPGNAPGGGGSGGSGGIYTVAWPGGKGARGGAWIVARMQ